MLEKVRKAFLYYRRCFTAFLDINRELSLLYVKGLRSEIESIPACSHRTVGSCWHDLSDGDRDEYDDRIPC